MLFNVFFVFFRSLKKVAHIEFIFFAFFIFFLHRIFEGACCILLPRGFYCRFVCRPGGKSIHLQPSVVPRRSFMNTQAEPPAETTRQGLNRQAKEAKKAAKKAS